MFLVLDALPEGATTPPLTGALDGLGIPVSTLTPAGLLAVVIILIAMGRLVPRRTMEDVIHDRNEWRTAHRISEASRAELAGMVEELLEHARTTDAFIRSLPHPSGQPAPAYPAYGDGSGHTGGSHHPPPAHREGDSPHA